MKRKEGTGVILACSLATRGALNFGKSNSPIRLRPTEDPSVPRLFARWRKAHVEHTHGSRSHASSHEEMVAAHGRSLQESQGSQRHGLRRESNGSLNLRHFVFLLLRENCDG